MTARDQTRLDRLVRCFCVAAGPSSMNRGCDQIGYAVDEEGHTLASHYSSYGWSKHDMGLTSTLKHEVYAQRYPEGFRVEWLDATPADWDQLKEEASNGRDSRPDEAQPRNDVPAEVRCENCGKHEPLWITNRGRYACRFCMQQSGAVTQPHTVGDDRSWGSSPRSATGQKT